VPLRTTISKHLVRAFYNEDVEMKHKIKVRVDFTYHFGLPLH
jgi:hypothetical protein